MAEIGRRLRAEGIPFRENVLGSKLTTFGSGGAVRFLLLPRNAAEVARALTILREESVPSQVIGAGSNILLPDEGYDGALIRLTALSSVERKGRCLRVGAGVPMPRLARVALGYSLSGAEFAAGIPGETGGSTARNAGAFGQAMSDLIEEVTILTDGRIEHLPAAALEMTYHDGRLPAGSVVLSVLLHLAEGEGARIEAAIRDMREKRRATQPTMPSAGSVFRRADGKPAALFIEETGLKGRRIGGAMLSEKHCNFIVNVGGAATGDYFALAELVRKEVKKRAKLSLEYEVERIICSRTRN